MKIFGREPAAFIAVIGSFFTVLAGMGIEWLSASQATAIVAVISGLVLAWATRPITPGLLTGAWAAVVGLLAEYQLNLGDEVVAGVSGLILALFAFITREQVSPIDTPVLTHS